MKSMNRIKQIVLLLLSMFLLAPPFTLHGGEASIAPLMLEDAVHIGLQKSRALEIARLDRDMAGQKIRETWSSVLPQISTNFTYTRTLKPSVLLLPPNPMFPTGVLETSSDNAGRASLDIRQPLFNASAFAGIKAAGIVRKMAGEAYRGAEATVVADIKISYFEVLIAKEQLKLVEQSIARWEQSRKETKAMFRQGVAADIDTLKAFLSVENLRPDLLQAQNRVLISMTKLKNVMGLPADTTLLLGSKLAPATNSFPDDIAGAYQEALRARPELQQLGYQVEAEGHKVSAARAERYPLLSAFGKLESQTAFDDRTPLSAANWPTSSSVGLQLSMPIFTGFRISSQIEQAKIGQMQTRTRVEKLKATMRTEIEVRMASFQDSQKRIAIQSKTISVADRSYRISSLRFREGLGSRLELTDAELQLNKAKTNYLQAVYDNLAAAALLEKALGRGRESW